MSADEVPSSEFRVPGTGQPPLETDDWPQPEPGIWPDILAYGSKRSVRGVTLSFGGSIDLVAGSPEDALMAQKLHLGEPLWLHVEAVCTETGKHKMVKGDPLGMASVTVSAAVRSDNEAALKMAADLEVMRRAYHRLRNAAQVYVNYTKQAVPEYNPDAADNLARKALERVEGAIESGKWVPRAKGAMAE